METIAHVTYRYQIFVQGDCVIAWECAQPLGALARGDFIAPATLPGEEWPGISDLVQRGEMLQVRWIEHAISFGVRYGRELVHQTMIDCVALPDTWEKHCAMRTSGCMFHAED